LIKNFRKLLVCKVTKVKEITISYDGAFRFDITEYSIKTPNYVQEICPKHVEFFTK